MLNRLFLSVLLTAPMYPQGAPEVHELPDTPVFKTSVVARTTKAINYKSRSGATKIDFVGTALMPSARGEAKVEAKKGYIEIEVEFQNLGSPSQFGAEYLTYVFWSVSPEGRATNLGELVVNKQGRAKLNVTSELQVFGLIITAEPYFAVRQPSDLIVMENEIRKGTKGRIFFIDAKTELLERGQYAALANPLGLTVNVDQAPLDLYQARNALQISKMLGAAEYASDTFKKAE
ncbi:MAG: OmpA family protein, partial [bacterium]|nr:OmpA family protein [bacterium]